MRNIIFSLVMTFTFSAVAAPAVAIKGKVTKIENGSAVLKSDKFGELLIDLKHVGKKEKATLKTAAASGKPVRMMLMASQLKRAPKGKNLKLKR